MSLSKSRENTLLGTYRPMTDGIGFVQAPLKDVITFCNAWLCPQDQDPAEMFRALFDEAMGRMDPPESKILFIECRSGWTSIFGQGYPEAETSYISENLQCHGVMGRFIEDTYNPKTDEGEMGAVQLRVYEPRPTDLLNYGRTISVTNQETHWVFDIDGDPLPCEDLSRYKVRRVRDRFTKEMLIEYLQRGFGIDAYNKDFYTDNCAYYPPRRQTYFGTELKVDGKVIG